MPKYQIKKTKLKELKPTTSALARYDWNSCRDDYINGMADEDGAIVFPPNKVLAEKYGIPLQSLLNKISKERWSDHRSAREREKSIEIHQLRLKKLAKKAVVFDETTADGAQLAQKLIADRLAELVRIRERDQARISRVLDDWEVADDEEIDMEALKIELRPMMWSTEIFELAKAQSLFAETGRRALGIKEDETGETINNQINLSVTQNVQRELTSDDETRAAALLGILNNPNLVLPGFTRAPDIDAEVVEEALEITAAPEGTDE
jgi:hypothetical protein